MLLTGKRNKSLKCVKAAQERGTCQVCVTIKLIYLYLLCGTRLPEYSVLPAVPCLLLNLLNRVINLLGNSKKLLVDTRPIFTVSKVFYVRKENFLFAPWRWH